MNGKDYVALKRISDICDNTTAAAGETCERVPAADLADLLAEGAIELAQPVEVTRRGKIATGDADGRS